MVATAIEVNEMGKGPKSDDSGSMSAQDSPIRQLRVAALAAALALGFGCKPYTTIDMSRYRADRELAKDDATERPEGSGHSARVSARALAIEGGRSVEGRPLLVSKYGDGPKCVLVLGAIHGNEAGSHILARDLEAWLAAHPEVHKGLRVVFSSPVNPDGLVRGTRSNARGIDLNRNFPATTFRPSRGRGAKPLCEPESRFVMKLIQEHDPALIISVHQPRRSVNWDGPAAPLAREMAVRTGYRLEASVGYSTPGSLGSYFGKDLKRPIITLELPRRRSAQKTFFEECVGAFRYALEWVQSMPKPRDAQAKAR